METRISPAELRAFPPEQGAAHDEAVLARLRAAGAASAAEGAPLRRSLSGVAEDGRELDGRPQAEQAAAYERGAPEERGLLPSLNASGPDPGAGREAGRVRPSRSGIAESSQDGLSQDRRPQDGQAAVKLGDERGPASEEPGSLPSLHASAPGVSREGGGLLHTGTIGPYHIAALPLASGGLRSRDSTHNGGGEAGDVLGASPVMVPALAHTQTCLGSLSPRALRADAAIPAWHAGNPLPGPPNFPAADAAGAAGCSIGLGYDAGARRASSLMFRGTVAARRPSAMQRTSHDGADSGGGIGGGNGGRGGVLRRVATTIGLLGEAAGGAERARAALPRRQSVVEALLAEELRTGTGKVLASTSESSTLRSHGPGPYSKEGQEEML